MLDTPDSDNPKALVRRAIELRGAEPVARRLGVSRSSLLAWLTGTSREGTSLLIETRVRALTTGDLVNK